MPFAATAPGAAAGAHRIAHGHLRGAAESDAALKLGRNVLGHKLRVGGHVVYFHDVHQHVLAGHLGELSLDLLLLSALTADDHARLRAMDGNADAGLAGGVVDRALDLDLGHAGIVKLLFSTLRIL